MTDKQFTDDEWPFDGKGFFADDDLNTDDWTEEECREASANATECLHTFQGPQIPITEDWLYQQVLPGFMRKREEYRKQLAADEFVKEQGKLIDLSDDAFILDNFDLVEGLIPVRGRVGILGKYKSGKSVISTALGLHIATGKDIGDRFVEQGVVMHIMSEGDAQRNKNRVLAWCRENDVSTKDILGRYIPLSYKYNLTETHKELADDVIFYGGADRVDVVIIDPLIENFRGNENSSEDMISFLDNAHKIAKLIDGVVIIPHHTGMDQSRGARGSTAYEGAMDIVLKIENTGTQVKVKSSASRDGILGDGIKGEIISHEIGTNNRNRAVSSPVFMFKGNLSGQEDGTGDYKHWNDLTPNQERLVTALYGRFKRDRGKPEREEFVEQMVSNWPGDNLPRTKRQSVNRTITSLMKKGVLAEDGTMLGLAFDFHQFWQNQPRPIADEPAE